MRPLLGLAVIATLAACTAKPVKENPVSVAAPPAAAHAQPEPAADPPAATAVPVFHIAL